MYCEHCGRKINKKCICIASSRFSVIEKGLLVLFVMILPLHLAMMSILTDGFVTYQKVMFNLSNQSLVIIVLFLGVLGFIFHRPYLALFFNCHQRIDRTFKIKNHYLSICARCSGILVGFFILLLLRGISIPWWLMILLSLPLIIDGLTQYYGKQKSNQYRRFITGLLFAPFVVMLLSYYNHLIVLIARNFIAF